MAVSTLLITNKTHILGQGDLTWQALTRRALIWRFIKIFHLYMVQEWCERWLWYNGDGDSGEEGGGDDGGSNYGGA